MKTFPWEVLVLAVVLAVNRLGTPQTYFRPAAFWAIQAMNVALGVAVAVYGLPGLTGFPQVGWLIAGLLAFHVFQNVALRSQALQKRARDEAERDRMRKLRALDKAEASEPPSAPDAP